MLNLEMENEKQISVDPLLGSIILNAHILDYPTQRAFTTRLLDAAVKAQLIQLQKNPPVV